MDKATKSKAATPLVITDSFDGLLDRMAALDHAGILSSGRKILKQAKRLRIEPSMRMSEVIQMTRMTQEDLRFFNSCRLIEVTESADDPVLSFRDVFCLLKIFSRFINWR